MYAGLKILQENETDLLKSTGIETYTFLTYILKYTPFHICDITCRKPGNELLSYHNIVEILHHLKEL